MTEREPELGVEQQALARSRLYGLLARVFVRGVDARSLAQLEQLGLGLGDHSADDVLDELAAEHHAWFGLEVFPYAGVFLDPAAQAGACADLVRGYYEQAGFAPRLSELSADHLGIELAFLAFVTGAQAEAHRDGRPDLASRYNQLLAGFIDACVLAYLPALVCACEAPVGVASGVAAFWPKLARATLELVAEHRSQLPGPLAPVTLPVPEPLLHAKQTGLRELARHLLTPAKIGVFLSRAQIGALGRRHAVPRGFGPRELMLDNLLRSAAEYGELTGLLDSLDALLIQRDNALAQLGRDCAIEPAIVPWRGAIIAARALLEVLRDASAASRKIMDIEAFYDDATGTLTYVVFDPESRDAVVIDPVLDYDPASSEISHASVDRVSVFLRKRELDLRLILETHAHADHLSGSQVLKRRFPSAQTGIGAKITVVQAIFKDVFDLPAEFPTDGRQFDRLLHDGEVVEVGRLRFEVIATPGHTPGCVSYRFGDALFTGDALFMPDSGTGRCDFPAGSAEDLYDSITQRIYTLPDETRVFVGHDYQPGGRALAYQTTVGEQKASNIQLPADRPREAFVEFRTKRDAGLSAPKLLFQSVQVNVDAGALPDPSSNQTRYLKIPINAFRPQPEDPGAIVGETI